MRGRGAKKKENSEFGRDVRDIRSGVGNGIGRCFFLLVRVQQVVQKIVGGTEQDDVCAGVLADFVFGAGQGDGPQTELFRLGVGESDRDVAPTLADGFRDDRGFGDLEDDLESGFVGGALHIEQVDRVCTFAVEADEAASGGDELGTCRGNVVGFRFGILEQCAGGHEKREKSKRSQRKNAAHFFVAPPFQMMRFCQRFSPWSLPTAKQLPLVSITQNA